MGESICVNISAPAFSLLLYENTRNEYDQEGFLLGEIVTKQKRTITDNDQEVINIERTVKVNSAIPCPKMAHFYDSSGRLNKKRIKLFLSDQFANVVCWYKFKHTSSFKLTLREKIVMKQLAKYFMAKAPEHFLCCLLTMQTNPDNGTQLFSQTFIRYNNLSFHTLPMHIVNLKDPYDIYKSPEECSKTFKMLVQNLKVDVKKTSGYAVVSRIEKGLDEKISEVVGEVSKAEKKMYSLENEVKNLRKRLVTLHESSDILENGVNDNDVGFMAPQEIVKVDPPSQTPQKARRGRSSFKTTRTTVSNTSEPGSPAIIESKPPIKSYSQAAKNKT